MPSNVFNPVEAVQLGQFVVQAYNQYSPGGAAFVLPAGYTLVTNIYADDITDHDPDYKMFGFIARSGSDVVVAIRGTEGFLEWIKDFDLVLVPFPYASAGKTEQGFNGFYSTFRTGPTATAPRVINALSQLVADGTVKSLRIAGHSLGSALATMLALDLAANSVYVSPVVYTFGSPRVGDKVFAGTYDNLVASSWRVTNMNDVVPQLPPQLAGYVHVDAEIPINSDDHCRQTVTCWHAILTYLNTLDPTVALDATCVPARLTG
jgi:predicted lipase